MVCSTNITEDLKRKHIKIRGCFLTNSEKLTSRFHRNPTIPISNLNVCFYEKNIFLQENRRRLFRSDDVRVK